MNSLKHARIMLIVKDGLNIHIMKDHMDSDTATIWIRVGSRKHSIVIGGIYREHLLLGNDNSTTTWMEKQREQEIRWQKIVDKWSNIGRKADCYIIGDINLDYLCWTDPEQHI